MPGSLTGGGELAARLRGLHSSDRESFAVPTDGTGTEGGKPVVHLDDEGVQQLRQHLRNDTMGRYQGCAVTIC